MKAIPKPAFYNSAKKMSRTVADKKNPAENVSGITATY
jgi:hypothetical protein